MRQQRLFWQGMVGLALGLLPLYASAENKPPIPPTQAVPGLHAVTAELEAETQLKAALPEALRRPDILRALRLRKDVPLAAYTPIQGAMNAPITLVEFADLNCLQCRDGLKLADSVFAKHKDKVRLAHRYAPFDRKASTNLAAFYGKLAHQQNVFWPFREALLNLTEFTPNTLGEALTKVGLNTRLLRQDFFPNARLFYSQLDEDAALATELKVKVPTQLFLNGMKIGEDIKPEDVDAMIDFLTDPKGQAALKNYDTVMHDDR
jgi:protein-disulfide isomerase